ncbi:MAG: glycosyltransferase [Ignavibacteriae bacterium]|nr:glycosyltransferase [Ignavibacteriota bacterium]
MSAQPHRISVVIPTSGRPSLAAVQVGLSVQSVVPQEICVIVDRDRRGPGWARNRGMEQASGDIIALLDDDTVPPPDWLASMVSALDETDADCAGGSFLETDPLLNDVRNTRPLPCERVLDGFGLVGNSGNLVLRRIVVDAMRDRHGHVFIESWGRYGSEDWELIMRIRGAGFRLVYVPCPRQPSAAGDRCRLFPSPVLPGDRCCAPPSIDSPARAGGVAATEYPLGS